MDGAKFRLFLMTTFQETLTHAISLEDNTMNYDSAYEAVIELREQMPFT